MVFSFLRSISWGRFSDLLWKSKIFLDLEYLCVCSGINSISADGPDSLYSTQISTLFRSISIVHAIHLARFALSVHSSFLNKLISTTEIALFKSNKRLHFLLFKLKLLIIIYLSLTHLSTLNLFPFCHESLSP